MKVIGPCTRVGWSGVSMVGGSTRGQVGLVAIALALKCRYGRHEGECVFGRIVLPRGSCRVAVAVCIVEWET